MLCHSFCRPERFAEAQNPIIRTPTPLQANTRKLGVILRGKSEDHGGPQWQHDEFGLLSRGGREPDEVSEQWHVIVTSMYQESNRYQ